MTVGIRVFPANAGAREDLQTVFGRGES